MILLASKMLITCLFVHGSQRSGKPENPGIFNGLSLYHGKPAKPGIVTGMFHFGILHRFELRQLLVNLSGVCTTLVFNPCGKMSWETW